MDHETKSVRTYTEAKAQRKAQHAQLLELAGGMNGRALMQDFLDCSRQGADDTEWDVDQFERWLVGVLRKAQK